MKVRQDPPASPGYNGKQGGERFRTILKYPMATDITTDNAPTGDVTITASRSVARCGVLVWTDNKYGPDGGIQDTVTYTASVSDPVKAFIKLKVSYGSAKIIKTSEDGKVNA